MKCQGLIDNLKSTKDFIHKLGDKAMKGALEDYLAELSGHLQNK